MSSDNALNKGSRLTVMGRLGDSFEYEGAWSMAKAKECGDRIGPEIPMFRLSHFPCILRAPCVGESSDPCGGRSGHKTNGRYQPFECTLNELVI